METITFLITLIVTLLIFLVILTCQSLVSAYKIGYYEQTLANNKSLFSESRYTGIERVMKLTFFKLIKNK